MEELKGSKLIFVEGLPATGKSTNCGILLTQLERNGFKVKWIHEVARPHPTLFFYEAGLTKKEFEEFVDKYPNAKSALYATKIERNQFIGIDLLEIQWNYLEQVGENAYQALQVFDVWNFPLEKYIEVALDKWRYFADQIRHGECKQVVLLDSSIFQFQIYTFLLKKAPLNLLRNFIKRIYSLINDLNPTLLYFGRENIEDTIAFLLKKRGSSFFNAIYKRDCHNPYYTEKPAGVEGYSEFLRDYNHIVNELFQITPFQKLKINITGQNWDKYVKEYLTFLGLISKESPNSHFYQGVFNNEDLGLNLNINGLSMIDTAGQIKRLIPRSVNEFYIENLPVILRFLTPEKIIIAGEQLIEPWTTLGTEYTKSTVIK
jgi:hypothetical protein